MVFNSMMMLSIWVKLPKPASDKVSEFCSISQVESLRVNGPLTYEKERVTRCIKTGTSTWVSFRGERHKAEASTYGATGRHTKASGIRGGSTATECGKGCRVIHI